MSSLNPSARIGVPFEGYRPDLHGRHIGPAACSLAKNVIVLDGTLRPRPAFPWLSWTPTHDTGTVTDSESTPASGTEFNHLAQAHAKLNFTYRTGATVTFELCEDGANGISIEAQSDGTFEIQDKGTGSETLYTSGGTFSDAVAYQIDADIDADAKLLRVQLDGTTVYNGCYKWCPKDLTGKITHTLVPNDIEIRIYPLGQIADRPLGLVQWNADSENGSVVMMTGSKWYRYNHTTNIWTDITGTNPLTGSAEALGVFRTFERGNITYLIGCNGADPPKYWDGQAATYSDVTGGPPVARVPIVSANRLVLAGAGTDRLLVDVSAFNDFLSGYGTVQQTLLGDTPGEIIAGMEINALRHVIYKTDAIYHGIAQAEFYGVATPFRYEAAATDVPGPVSPLALVGMPDGTQVYLAEDGGLYLFDGVRPIEIGRHIREHVQAMWDYSFRRQSWLTFDQRRKLLWVWYAHTNGGMQKGIVCATDRVVQGLGWPMWPVELPSGWEATAGGSLNLATVETIGDGSGHTIGSSHESIGSGRTFEPKSVVAISSGAFFSQQWEDAGTYKDGKADISVDCITGYSDLGIPHRFKTVSEIEHLIELESGESVSFQLKSADYGEDETTSATATVSDTTKPRTSSFRQTGKWFALRIFSAVVDRLFKWDGGIISFKPRGPR